MRTLCNMPGEFPVKFKAKQEDGTMKEVERKLNATEACRFYLTKTLEKCYKMIDLPEGKFPDPESTKLIALNVQKYHGDLSIQEVFYAFELAVNKILPVETKHYHIVGVAYVTDILRNYKHWKHEKMKSALNKIAEFSVDKRQELIDNEIKNNRAAKRIILVHYVKFLKGDESNYLLPSSYSYLVDLGELNLTDARKEELKQAAKQSMQVNVSTPLKGVMDNISGHGQIERAKILAVYDAFKKWQAEGLHWISVAKKLNRLCQISPNYYKNLIIEKQKDATN